MESIRKRPKKGEGEGEEPPKSTPCPFCSFSVPESDLRCPQCKNSLPYCVATGLHAIATDLTVCSSCKFPGFRSELLRMAQGGEDCPMCGNAMDEKLLTAMNPRYVCYRSIWLELMTKNHRVLLETPGNSKH